MNTLQNRYRGALLGLAAGDALGTTVEFRSRGSFEPLTDIVGGGPFALQAGQWTDDTSMALCLAESLLARRGIDPHDQLKRYTRWWTRGENSVTGHCFDIGNTVRSALENYASTNDPASGSTDHWSSGNGSIMRLAAVPLFFLQKGTPALVEAAAESSLTTHGSPECQFACRLMAHFIANALQAKCKDDVCAISPDFIEALSNVKDVYPTSVKELGAATYRNKTSEQIRGSGYVIESLEAALWCFHHSSDFQEGALLAANLGDDADTTAAVYGQIAGAFYGESGIPPRWLDILAWRHVLTDLADRLHSQTHSSSL